MAATVADNAPISSGIAFPQENLRFHVKSHFRREKS
jgi:hypothetical protein